MLRSSTGLWLRCREMRLSLARDRERGLATASLSGARMMSLFAALLSREGEPWQGSG